MHTISSDENLLQREFLKHLFDKTKCIEKYFLKSGGSRRQLGTIEK